MSQHSDALASTGDGRTTLLVNLCPPDHPHARLVLPHELRQLAGQVDEIQLSVDDNRPEAFDKAQWEERRRPLTELIEEVRQDPKVRVLDIDYSPETRRRVSEEWFGGIDAPLKDFRGRPFYTYMEAIHQVRTQYVLHLDSDMLLGGGSQTWVEEAKAKLRENPQWLVASPLAGPPRSDGTVLRQPTAHYIEPRPDFIVDRMSSRVFFFDIEATRRALGAIELTKAPLHGRLWTLRQDNPPYEKLENIIGNQMKANGYWRVDFLGTGAGMWSLHPPLRSARFYQQLPQLIADVEAGNVPNEQRGDFDVNDSMIDWSDARKAIRNERIKVMLGR